MIQIFTSQIEMRGKLLEYSKRMLSITRMWLILNWPGSPGKSCNDPRGDDGRKKSGSVFVATSGKNAGLELFKNHRTSEIFDAPGILGAVEGLNASAAARRFMELAGVPVKPLDEDKPTGAKQRKPAPAAKPVPPVAKPPFDHRVLSPRDLDADEVEAIATTRGVSARTVEHVMRFGVIHSVSLYPDLRLPIPREARPLQAWCLHVPDWSSFRLRPFGRSFPGFKGGAGEKTLTPSGGSCGSPVWIGDERASRVLIVEGEGDGLAAWEIARREKSEGLAVVVIFSSSIAIPSYFFCRFEGRRVRCVPHVGDTMRQGERAAVKWCAALKPWAASVEVFSLHGLVRPNGSPVGDMGDLCECPDDLLFALGGVTKW